MSSLKRLVGTGKTNLDFGLWELKTAETHPRCAFFAFPGGKASPYNGLPGPWDLPAPLPSHLPGIISHNSRHPPLTPALHSRMKQPCAGTCAHKVPLHWLCPLPGTPFLPSPPDQLPHLRQISAHKSPYSRGHPWPLHVDRALTEAALPIAWRDYGVSALQNKVL